MKKLTFLILPLLALGLIMPVFAPDVPYSFPPLAPSDCFSSAESAINSQGGLASDFGAPSTATGVRDTGFVGLTISNVGFYLCVLDNTNGPIHDFTDSNMVTIGTFDISTGALISTLALIPFSSLPHITCDADTSCPNQVTNTPVEFSFAPNHLIASNEMIGITFDSLNLNHFVISMCADPCLGTELVSGGVIIYAPSENAGYALAGDFVFDSPSGFANGLNQASVFVIVAMILLILAVVRETFKGRPEIADKVVLPAVIGLGIFFLILQAFAALIT